MTRPPGSLISYFNRRVPAEGGINFAQGKPGFLPPIRLIDILKEELDTPRLHQYAPGNGDPGLLELIAGRHSKQQTVRTDHLLVVQGATEGLHLVMLYLQQELPRPFTVLSFDPVYESYPRLADIFKLPFVRLDFQPDLSVDFDQLEQTVRSRRVKLILLASPGNPLGKVWNTRELQKLIRIAEQHEVMIVFDAVYKDLCFGAAWTDPLTLATENHPHPRLFFVDSFSKMLSITGWRIGYILAAEKHISRIRAIHDYTGLSAPHLFQIAIRRYLAESHNADRYCRQIREELGGSYRLLRQRLTAARCAIPEVQGGYFLWTKLPPAHPDGFQFAEALLEEESVAVVPGINFSPRKNDYIRLNMATRSSDLQEGIARMERFLARDSRD